MAYDCYKEAHALADLLRDVGLDEEASSLEGAIAGGSTATEILMALRWNLSRICNTHPNLDSSLQQRIGVLRTALDVALRQ